MGERVLLPAARQLDSDAVLVTDGFSCREQITQSTDRTPVHLAELLQQAIKADGPRHFLRGSAERRRLAVSGDVGCGASLSRGRAASGRLRPTCGA